MRFRSKVVIFLGASLVSALGFGQTNCLNGTRIEGVVTDPSGATVPGAGVQIANGTRTLSDAAGRYAIACIPPGLTTLHLEAQGFAPVSKEISTHAGETA